MPTQTNPGFFPTFIAISPWIGREEMTRQQALMIKADQSHQKPTGKIFACKKCPKSSEKNPYCSHQHKHLKRTSQSHRGNNPSHREPPSRGRICPGPDGFEVFVGQAQLGCGDRVVSMCFLLENHEAESLSLLFLQPYFFWKKLETNSPATGKHQK